MNISDYSYYRLYREAEQRMERELEARRVALERAQPTRRRGLLGRSTTAITRAFCARPARVVNRAGSQS